MSPPLPTWLNQALKKAKVFETRKIQRRILQAKEAAGKQGKPDSTPAPFPLLTKYDG